MQRLEPLGIRSLALRACSQIRDARPPVMSRRRSLADRVLVTSRSVRLTQEQRACCFWALTFAAIRLQKLIAPFVKRLGKGASLTPRETRRPAAAFLRQARKRNRRLSWIRRGDGAQSSQEGSGKAWRPRPHACGCASYSPSPHRVGLLLCASPWMSSMQVERRELPMDKAIFVSLLTAVVGFSSCAVAEDVAKQAQDSPPPRQIDKSKYPPRLLPQQVALQCCQN